jgi:hypothetical protein
MRRKTLIVLAFLLLTGACTRPASTLEAQPAPTGSVRLCGAADLQPSSSSNGATGAIVLGVTLINQSETPCALPGQPQVALSNNPHTPGAVGQTLAVQVIQAQADQAAPTSVTLTIAPGESIIAILIWRNYCGEALADGVTIRLTLTTGQSLDIQADALAVPRCDAKNEPSTLLVNPYSYPP